MAYGLARSSGEKQGANLSTISRRKSAFGHSGLYPFRQSSLGKLPAEGRAPHARNDGIGLAGACPHLATRYSFGPDDHVMPRLAYGLATQTRRPRPLYV